jgi:Ca2+-binding EF-hand superfamily protein
MDRLDIDRDGKITEHEIFRVLNGGASPEIIEQSLRKIAAGASGYGSLSEYVKDLVRRFDRNSDGQLSIEELAEGLQKLGIFLAQSEQKALMQKIDLDRDGEVTTQEILSALQPYGSSSSSSSGVDSILKRLAADGKSYSSLREYAAFLIRKFDRDNDGIISFQELCDGLAKLSIPVSQQDKKALMDRLDIDRDGSVTETELYKALSSVGGKGSGSSGYGATLVAENTLKKIGAKQFPSLNEYVKDLVRKFDKNSDGLLSMQELMTGLGKIGITLTNNEVQALMQRLDLNRDGEVSGQELVNVLRKYDTKASSNPQVNAIVKKLAEGGSKFPSMRDYARHLIKQFDRDSDGIITFNELCDGLLKLKIVVT